MKNLKAYLMLLICGLFATSVFAQREITAVTRNTTYKKMIHILPLPLFVGGLEFGFEKPTAIKESFYMQLGYYTSQAAVALDIKNNGYSDMNGLKLELQYRFYRKSNNYKKNMWIAPLVGFKTIAANFEKTTTVYNGPPNYNYTNTTINETRSASSVELGYMLGVRKAVFENVYFDLSFGGALYIPVAGDNHSDFNIPVFNPYQRAIQFKGNIGFCIAL